VVRQVRRAPEPLEGPNGTRVSEIVVAPATARPVRSEELTICLVCLDGTGTLDEATGTYLVRPGLMAVRLPGWSGRLNAANAPLRLVAFGWSRRGLAALGALSKGVATARVLYGRSSVELAWRSAEELRIRDPYTPNAIQVFCDGVAVGLARNLLYGDARASSKAEKARRTLEKHIDQPLDLGALAAAASCTPAYLTRLFRQTYGFSPTQYQLRRRIDRARRLLTTTSRPIADLARELGFHDASHFARHFRRLAGLSPLEFRSRQREVISVPV
jgi:AraC-like DNA-binding protein